MNRQKFTNFFDLIAAEEAAISFFCTEFVVK